VENRICSNRTTKIIFYLIFPTKFFFLLVIAGSSVSSPSLSINLHAYFTRELFKGHCNSANWFTMFYCAMVNSAEHVVYGRTVVPAWCCSRNFSKWNFTVYTLFEMCDAQVTIAVFRETECTNYFHQLIIHLSHDFF